jgi:hypothetical protein
LLHICLFYNYYLLDSNLLVLPYLRHLVAGLHRGDPGFDPGLDNMGFVVGIVVLGRISFPSKTPCGNTVAIYRRWTGIVRENIYLYDMQVATCLVDAYEDCSCIGGVSFLSCWRLQNGTKNSD